jgi:hypothetical protein
MNEKNKENLKAVFERFFDSADTGQVVEDVLRGERILRENPAPRPDEQLLTDIKAQMAAKLHPRRRRSFFMSTAFRAAAVAAAVIIAATLTVVVVDIAHQPRADQIATITPSIWESSDIAEDDRELAMLTAEVEQINAELLAFEPHETNGNGSGALAELEIELIEIDSDFWKG